jgi:hypothetical protein
MIRLRHCRFLRKQNTCNPEFRVTGLQGLRPAMTILLLILTACAIPSDPEIVYQRQDMTYPSLDNIPVCRSYGCAKIEHVHLTKTEQETIKNLFKSNGNAPHERRNIKTAIAAFENIFGNKTGTSADIGGTYVRLGHYQQDCVDESTNTTTYLLLLEQMELLQYHKVNALTSRAPILSGRLGPHRTAVITEIATGQKFAVDSWFHDNGFKPEIIELDIWKNGWHPSKP